MDNVDEAVSIFTKEFTAILDVYAPMKTIQIHKNYVPYLDSKLKQKMKFRDLLKKSWHKSGDEEVHLEYKKLRNEICTEIKEAKKAYFETNLNSKDMKNSWSTVHKILQKPKNDFPQKMIIQNKLITKPAELAEEMNAYFTNKIAQLKENSDSETDTTEATKSLHTYLKKNNKTNLHFEFEMVDDEQMYSIVD